MKEDYLLLLLISITPQILPLTCSFLKEESLWVSKWNKQDNKLQNNFLKMNVIRNASLIALRKKHLWREPSNHIYSNLAACFSMELFKLCFTEAYKTALTFSAMCLWCVLLFLLACCLGLFPPLWLAGWSWFHPCVYMCVRDRSLVTTTNHFGSQLQSPYLPTALCLRMLNIKRLTFNHFETRPKSECHAITTHAHTFHVQYLPR